MRVLPDDRSTLAEANAHRGEAVAHVGTFGELGGKLVGGGRVNIDVKDDDLVVDAQSEPERLLPATV